MLRSTAFRHGPCRSRVWCKTLLCYLVGSILPCLEPGLLSVICVNDARPYRKTARSASRVARNRIGFRCDLPHEPDAWLCKA